MKRRGLFSQTAHTLGSMAGNQGLQIAAGIAISRVYGPAGKGLVTYAGIAIMGVFAIADGLNSAVARQCAEDGTDVDAAATAAVRLIALVSAIGAVPLIALGALVPAQHALMYVGIAFPFALYFQTMSGFHLIALRVERTNVASLVINAGAALAMLVATLAARPPIDIIMILWAAGYVGGAGIVYGGLKRLRSEPRSVDRLFAAQLRFALRSSSASLITFLAARVDVFIVAAALTASALGSYTLALACGELMWQLGRALSWSAYGRVATLQFDAAAALAARITRIVLAAELITAVVAFVAGPTAFRIVYGPAFAAAGPVLRILIPGMALYAADSILTYFISVKIGRPGAILRVEIATLIVCTVGSLTTIGHFGMIGPAVATTLAYLTSFSVKAIYFARATGIGLRSLLVVTRADVRRGILPVERPGPAAA